MGISVSKYFRESRVSPELEITQDIDPRSPTLHISRTPLNVLLSKSGEKITKSQDLTNIKTPVSGSLENVFPRTKQLEILMDPLDPRSPSLGIQRTPLSIADESEVTVEVSGEQDNSAESFESALSKLDFNSFDDAEEQDDKEGILETDFEYNPPEEVKDVKEDIDPRSPGIERTPFVFEDDEEPQKSEACENSTPKSVLNPEDRPRNAALKVFQDENSQEIKTPKQNLTVGENRTPLSCLGNRGIPKTDSALKTVLKTTPLNSENHPGMSGKRAYSKIPLSTARRFVEN
ncbi:hypothetical protein DMENIID0001_096850 [Sergentomyia squamirostris]